MIKRVLKSIIPQPLQDSLRTGLDYFGRYRQVIPPSARFYGLPDKDVFFGYYDISPFSADNRKLLAGVAPPGVASPHTTPCPLMIGFYDLTAPTPAFTAIATTPSWNWQQGCRLQWYPRESAYETVIYNTIVDGQYAAAIHTIGRDRPDRIIAAPVYTMSADGAFALSLNFSRLHQCRPGYGYNNFPVTEKSDDIILIDMRTGECRSVLSLSAIESYMPQPSMSGAQHYLNHLSFSPTGERFMVTHLWVTAAGKRQSRLLIATRDGQLLYCPNNAGWTSHYTWLSDDEVIVFGAHEDGKYGYYRYDLPDQSRQRLAPDFLVEDGHPTPLAPGRLLTDTYPDFLRRQSILVYDEARDKGVIPARFHVPRRFTGESRCDLHPRINSDGTKICVDAVRGGKRVMCVFDVPGQG